MYTTSDIIAEEIEKDSRCFRIWIRGIDTNDVYIGDDIFNGSSDQQSTSNSENVELGAICSQTWTISSVSINKDILGKQFNLYLYLLNTNKPYTTWGDIEGKTWEELSDKTVLEIYHLGEILGDEPIPMGRFTAVKVNKTADGSQITLADRLYFANREYTGELSGSACGIEGTCCYLLGIEKDYNFARYLYDKNNVQLLDSSGNILMDSFDFYIEGIPKGSTIRQVMSYIASYCGYFGIINRFGEYERKWYNDCEYVLSPDRTDVPTFSEVQNKIGGVSRKVNNEVVEYGDCTGKSGKVLEIENPLFPNYSLQSKWEENMSNFLSQNFTYNTAELNLMLGDPRLDIGDVCAYENTEKIVPVMSMAYSFDGGLSAKIKSNGTNDNELQLQGGNENE